MTIKFNKRIVSLVGATIFAALLVCMPLMTPHVVHAQAPGIVPGQPVRNPFTGQPIPEEVGPPKDAGCGYLLTDTGCVLTAWGKSIVRGISLTLLTIGAMILWVAGTVLDYVLVYTIVDMTKNLADLNLGKAINEVWRVARDFSNMFFIFILLYGAIITILGRDDINVKKVITRVVIVAILLNFSLLFTKIVIDVSNSATVAFYNRILQDVPAGGGQNGGLSVAFMNRFGLTSLWDSDTAASVLNSNAGGSTLKFFMLGLFGLTFMVVAAFVFFAIAGLFVVRYITLIFLLILSPLAFAATALPKDEYSGRWKKALLNQAIFAPVCMAMLWISLRILAAVVQTPPNLGGIIEATSSVTNTGATSVTSVAGSILNFVIAIGSVIAVLVVAQNTGAKGADSWLKRGKKWGVGLRKNMQSVIGRNTIGSSVPLVGANWWNKKLVESERFNTIAAAKTPAVKLFGKTVIPQIGVGRLADSARKATVQNLAEQKFGGAYSRVSRDKEKKEQNTAIKENLRKAEIGNLIRDAKELTPEERAKLSPEQIKQREEQYQKLRQTLSNMSNKELESIKAKDLAPHISLINARQLEHVLDKSDKFNEEDKEKLRKTRFKVVNEAITTLEKEKEKRDEIAKITDAAEQKAALDKLETSLDESRTTIQALATKEIELAGAEFISREKFVENLNQSQADALTKTDNNNFTPDQRNRMKEWRKDAINAAMKTTGTSRKEAINKISKMEGKDLAKLKLDILTDPEVMRVFTKKKLAKMADEIKDPAILTKIKEAIQTEATKPGSTPPKELTEIANWLDSPSGKDFF